MPQVQVKASAKTAFKQEIKANGHTFVSDAPASAGGSAVGPEPHELLLGALGACTSITLQMYAQRKGWDLKDVTVTVTEERIDDPEHPGRAISKISREIAVDGELTAEQVDVLKGIADKCPIHKLLSGPKLIETNISLN
ncbi:MAG TPA: OsmC family protein [Candidatus Obscuribacterales bacterium]